MYVCNGLRPSYASRPWGLLPCPVFVAPFGTLTWTSRGRPVSLSRHWDLWMTVNRSGPAQWMWRMWWKNCRKIPGAAENGRTFLKDLGPSGSQDVARWYDRYLASSWLTVRLYLHLQLQGFEASDCKIHYNPSQSQPKTINPIFSEPKLRHAAMRALQSRQSSGSQAPDRICLQLVGGQIHGCGALVALDVS
jgi:hypothetical protein